MTNPWSVGVARWRALLELMWRAGRGWLLLFGALVLVVGLMPTVVIVATGALVAGIPGAVEHGLAGAEGKAAMLALSFLVGSLVALALGSSALRYVSRVLDTATAVEIYRVVATATLGTPGLAPLEDPVFADQLQSVDDAERRGTLRWTAASLSTVATTRLRGAGAFAVLLAFQWWAP
ncbi:MAG TPA: hypothetical protein VM759_13040, partial [Longimicrobium sp.]|nr:hypothetical protein [Longimicrobium sp.]